MTDEERSLTPEPEPELQPTDEFDSAGDDLRYAPPVLPDEEPAAEPAPDSLDELVDPVPEIISGIDDTPIEDIVPDVPEFSATDGLDIEAALAAVSTLSDVIAEEEAAEQARLARLEAEAQAKIERQRRLENPELFFPVPPMLSLRRGQFAALVPAVLLIAFGAWLTFSLTTTRQLPDPALILSGASAAVGLSLLSHWLASGRWSHGTLFFGWLLLLLGLLLLLLLQPAFPVNLVSAWPILFLAPGLAMLLTAFLGYPSDRKLIFPALLLILTALSGWVVTSGLLGAELLTFLASLWPAAVVVVVIVLLIPAVFRQRQ